MNNFFDEFSNLEKVSKLSQQDILAEMNGLKDGIAKTKAEFEINKNSTLETFLRRARVKMDILGY